MRADERIPARVEDPFGLHSRHGKSTWRAGKHCDIEIASLKWDPLPCRFGYDADLAVKRRGHLNGLPRIEVAPRVANKVRAMLRRHVLVECGEEHDAIACGEGAH